MADLSKEEELVDYVEMFGDIIDMPQGDFITKIEEQKVPIGVLLNLKISLTGIYNNLNDRRKAIVFKINKGELEKNNDTIGLLNGLYAEMTKIEMKVLYIVERVKQLQDVG